MSDGGKGSERRNEDSKKVRENWDLIDWSKKDDAKKDEKKNYKPGDMSRPRPRVIDPGTTTAADVPGRPPADATVLFDGKSLRDEWAHSGRTDADAELKWKVENGYAEVKGGSIQTKRRFGDSQVHIEWAAPKEVKGNGQGRGNSGVYLGGFGEVQVLDSFNNDTYPDGQAAALYNRFPPLVNASVSRMTGRLRPGDDEGSPTAQLRL